MFVFSSFAYFLSNKRRLFKQNDTLQQGGVSNSLLSIISLSAKLRKENTQTVAHTSFFLLTLINK